MDNKEIFKQLTLEDVFRDAISLLLLTKYKDITDDALDKMWFDVAEIVLNEDEFKEFKEKNRLRIGISKDKHREYCRLISSLYNNKFDDLKKTSIISYDKYRKYGIDLEDRSNPDWAKQIYNFWKENFYRYLYNHDHPATIVNLAEGDDNVEYYKELEKYFIASGFNENTARRNTNRIKDAVLDKAKDVKGSMVFSLNLIKNNGEPMVFETIILNNYMTPISYIHTLWHETTHYLQNNYLQSSQRELREIDKLLAIDEESFNNNPNRKFIEEKEMEIAKKREDINKKRGTMERAELHKLEEELKEEINSFNKEYRRDIEYFNNKRTELIKRRDDINNKYSKYRLLIETHANLNGSMITFLQAISLGCQDLQRIKRELIMTSGVDPWRGYCDFVLTKENLDRLENDLEFRNQFFNDKGEIDFKKLYEYTYDLSKSQSEEIFSFFEKFNCSFIDGIKDESLLWLYKTNPLYKIKTAKDDYSKSLEGRTTFLEDLLDNMHCFKSTKSSNMYYCILLKMELMAEINNLGEWADLFRRTREIVANNEYEKYNSILEESRILSEKANKRSTLMEDLEDNAVNLSNNIRLNYIQKAGDILNSCQQETVNNPISVS